MDDSPLILIDVSNLAYRCHYTTGKLENGVLYGFFKYILSLEQKLQSTKMVFCFDTRPYYRSLIYPDYKKKGNPKSEEEQEDLFGCFRQINLLKESLLEELGYANVFWTAGFEADDIITSIKRKVVITCSERPSLIAVSTDRDLYQLLGWKLDIWNPAKNKIYSCKDFVTEWNIDSSYWYIVKAISGCKSDNILGIKGVGEKTAIKHLKGELKESSQASKRIDERRDIIDRNLKLTKLPFEGTPEFEIKKDDVTVKKWKEVMKNLGLKTLINTCPVATRKF